MRNDVQTGQASQDPKRNHTPVRYCWISHPCSWLASSWMAKRSNIYGQKRHKNMSLLHQRIRKRGPAERSSRLSPGFPPASSNTRTLAATMGAGVAAASPRSFPLVVCPRNTKSCTVCSTAQGQPRGQEKGLPGDAGGR